MNAMKSQVRKAIMPQKSDINEILGILHYSQFVYIFSLCLLQKMTEGLSTKIEHILDDVGVVSTDYSQLPFLDLSILISLFQPSID